MRVWTFIFGSAPQKEGEPPGMTVPALIPDLRYDSSRGEGILELRENRERNRAMGTRGTGIEHRTMKGNE